MIDKRFADRSDAGRRLAEELTAYAAQRDVLVLALPRGGVPVAFEVARALNAPLDVFLVRKLGVPGHEELAMGAIASGGVRVLNREVLQAVPVPENEIDAVARRERIELERREIAYRAGRPPPVIPDKTVILIDDGLATGSSMLAAVRAVRIQNPARVIVAVPVAASDVCEAFREHVDDIVCLATPSYFTAVGSWYDDFSQTTDEEVCELLDRSS